MTFRTMVKLRQAAETAERKYFAMSNYIQFGVARAVQTTTPCVCVCVYVYFLWLFKGSKYIT